MKSILITGASSGIGEALARSYAAPGVTLHLSGTDATRLDSVAAACRESGAEVSPKIIDVRDAIAMQRWLEAVDDATPLALVIANAGISGGPDADKTRQIFDVNVTGVLNTVLPVQPRMLARGQGTIALVSSVAGNRGMPSAPAYSASKAAVLAYGEGLRGQLRNSGVTVSVICPGFVKSRITDANDFPMPFFMEADRAAAFIRRGLARGQAKITFPWQMRVIGWILRSLPSGLGTALLSRLPEKS